MLQLVDAPLNPAEAPLSLRLDDADSFEHVSNFDLLQELVEAALEHAILGALFTAATASREEALDVEDEGVEDGPMDVLVLPDALFSFLLLSLEPILRSYDGSLNNILALTVRTSRKIHSVKSRGEQLVETIES